MALFPVDELEALLVLRARARSPISYGEVCAWFGLPFSRHLVRQLCAALDEVDARQRGAGRPELAVLVVRRSDGLPGQGWWLSKSHDPWDGAFTGPEARRFVERHQARAYAWWADRREEA
ncbi:MAG: ribose-phosphate pyrophosphokinase [Sphingomonadaceae bacterium]|uniref:ribose-phosphate pyrophosphokinase n=1 Tax=Thermaurantiacus sp. TaxID=2820283 RepID=UPI00298EE3BE|nr:ribose-phosphate pyrophosphokinase [Thermaurantiacus sp.]MCS6987469.1 ribose-phosphate pyrophosphokinase [Sphingomonadaceae bacterium]MDW8415389.1 ribose-phosphate pyrophosphokinase [Thermaurantiacus sp.]